MQSQRLLANSNTECVMQVCFLAGKKPQLPFPSGRQLRLTSNQHRRNEVSRPLSTDYSLLTAEQVSLDCNWIAILGF